MLFVFLFQLLWPICGGSPLGIRSNDHRIIPSCQQVFEFRMRTDYYVYGMLTVPSPPLNRFSVPLLVKFMLNSRLPTKYGGLLELRRSQDETLKDIRQRRHVQFIIHFPVQSPLPLLTMVLWDNEVLCGAAGFVPPAASVFNRIEYRYTFNTFDIRPDEPVTTISNPIRPATLAAPVSHAMRWMDPAIATTTNSPTTTTQRPPRRQQSNCGQLHDQANRFAAHDGRQLLERGAWPWLAAIYATRPAGPRFQCVGTLISSTIVLTAASCMTRPAEPQQASTTDDSNMPSESNHTFFHAEELLVMLGRHNMSKWFEPGTLIRELLSLHIHPEFMNSDAVGIRQNADIAALRMRSNVEYRLFIMPVCLFATTDDDKIQPMSNGNVGFQGTVVGWGEGGHERETRLSATPAAMTLSAVHWSQCVREAGPSNAQTNDQQKRFCASIRNERSDSPCVADAGSGFIVLQHNRFALRGIMTGDGWTFLGATCSRRDYFAFTDVNRFVDWIEQFME